MKSIYSKKQINVLKQGFADFMRSSDRLYMELGRFVYRLKNERAIEFMSHGFLRRFETLQRCIENIYRLSPPEQVAALTSNDRKDLEINLQAFVFNVFGALDNLAWVTVSELNLEIPLGRVGFLKEEMDERLSNAISEGFRRYITSKRLLEWQDYMRDFRHALGHRIPFYVPPKGLTKTEIRQYKEIEIKMAEALQKLDHEAYERLLNKQLLLGRNLPVITHSFSEGSKQMLFHSQVLADFNTVVEIATKFINEFEAFHRKT